jgi:anti-anti-sigma factor
MFMLHVIVFEVGTATMVRCRGRIGSGDDYSILRNALLSQTHARTLVLDLAQVDRIDAGGLGILLGLREWTRSKAIRFRLMNVMNQALEVFELTKLDSVFEFCSVKDMFHLLHHAAAVTPSVGDESALADPMDAGNVTCRWQEATIAMTGDSYRGASS